MGNEKKASFDLAFDPDKVYDLDDITDAHSRTSNKELKIKVVNSQENMFNEDVTDTDGELAISTNNKTEERLKIKRADIRNYLFNN